MSQWYAASGQKNCCKSEKILFFPYNVGIHMSNCTILWFTVCQYVVTRVVRPFLSDWVQFRYEYNSYYVVSPVLDTCKGSYFLSSSPLAQILWRRCSRVGLGIFRSYSNSDIVQGSKGWYSRYLGVGLLSSKVYWGKMKFQIQFWQFEKLNPSEKNLNFFSGRIP